MRAGSWAAGRRAPGARGGGGPGRAPERRARGKPAKSAGARRLVPPPAPTHRVWRSSPRPFLFPRREGRGARPVCVVGPAQAQVCPPAARRGGRGGVGPHLRSTPPSSEALRHSGGERRRCTSATVTLYFEVELRSERRPGTEQKTSLGFTTPPKRLSLFMGMAETALLLDLDRDTGPAETDREAACGRRGSLPKSFPTPALAQACAATATFLPALKIPPSALLPGVCRSWGSSPCPSAHLTRAACRRPHLAPPGRPELPPGPFPVSRKGAV